MHSFWAIKLPYLETTLHLKILFITIQTLKILFKLQTEKCIPI